jgi:hypothetical protein
MQHEILIHSSENRTAVKETESMPYHQNFFYSPLDPTSKLTNREPMEMCVEAERSQR